MVIFFGDLLIGEPIFILLNFYIIFHFVEVKALKYLQKIEVYSLMSIRILHTFLYF